MLEQAVAIVTAIASAMTALELLAQFQPDILVSNIGMPEVDGYTLMHHICPNLSARCHYCSDYPFM